MRKMKIRVKYYANDESKAPMTMDVEVAEGECKIMIEQDYQQRKRAAAEGEPVVRRSAQEIIDGEFNRPLYNDWHREHRRRTEFPDYQSRDEQDGALANPIEYAPDTYTCRIAGSGCRRNGKTVPDMSLVSRDELNRAKNEDNEAVCQTVRTVLEKKPEWADAVIAVFINGESIREYSARVGANENNITQKLKRAKKKLQNFFANRQK
jgi:DNA-directed RNA polymerase specialized sigma24 family protein